MPRTARRLALALLLSGCSGEVSETTEPPEPPALDERERVLGPFLSKHLRFPVPPQGPAPAGFSEVDASLEPVACGSCHPAQYALWQASLHAGAYSPGFSGQLIEGQLAHPLETRSCQACHAPLSEQQPHDATMQVNGGFDPGLRAQGIVCAVCHVRAHTRYGPPRRSGVAPAPEPPPHAGFQERPEFQESRFCAQCHQFFDDAGVNGKPLQNTFFEWQQSPQAAAGRPCQACHMPDRAHLWRGIHDAEMVRRAVEVELVPIDLSGEQLSATLVLANTDVGHAFPTYVTPRVFLVVYQVDDEGVELADTRVEGVIGRQVDLGSMVELFDTRVLPSESVRLDYSLPRTSRATALVAKVTVDPDFHYRAVFAQLLPGYTDPDARARIAEAIRRISDSTYVLSEIRQDL